jgi:peptide/nickel transport system ATP-binding protein
MISPGRPVGESPSAQREGNPVSAVLVIDQLDTVLETPDGLVHAVDALSLAVARGQTFALVGESGCGKSMTALSILRLLPDNGRVAGGAIRLAGTDLVQLPESSMRNVRGRRVSIIFQEPGACLNPVLTVGRQIVEVIERHTALRGATARARAVDWLRRVGLPEPDTRVDAFPFQLSGGQKQRVMIAMALAAEPDLLVADEPTTALDVTIQRQILELLRQLQRDTGMAMLLITHDLGIVRDMAQHVALMYAGQIVEVARVPEFFARPLHPYAQLLLAALPGAARRGERLAAIGGTVPPLTHEFSECRFIERCPAAQPRCNQPVALRPAAPGHEVRCVRYEADGPASTAPWIVRAGAAPTAQPAAPAERPAAWSAAPGEAVAPGELLLDVRELRVGYPIRRGLLRRTAGCLQAVDGVSFSLSAGRTLALVGESGCGKTTIGKALLQLLRGSARIEGQMRLSGASLSHLNGEALRQARRQLQIVFQDPYASLNPRLRVAEILEEGVAALRPQIDPAARRARIAALVERVGLPAACLARYPHEFSGGQRQRVAIARALAVEPRVIVCDEPTSALDVSVQAQILNLLRDLQAELGVAYLFITHNFAAVEYLADEVAVMRAGRIVEAGAAADLLSQPRDSYTRQLLAAAARI